MTRSSTFIVPKGEHDVLRYDSYIYSIIFSFFWCVVVVGVDVVVGVVVGGVVVGGVGVVVDAGVGGVVVVEGVVVDADAVAVAVGAVSQVLLFMLSLLLLLWSLIFA